MESTSLVPLVLAVDLGTSSLKAALVAIDGRILGWDSQPLKLILTPDGGCEQKPEDWWQAFLSVSKRLLDQHPEHRRRVIAVCCSTQGEGTIAVDRSGKPLCDAILWMDMRGADCLRRQLRGWINVEGAAVSKLLRFVRLTGGAPSMTGKDPAGHILWLRDQRPEIYSKAHKFLNVLDYMNFRLSGRMVATRDSIVTNWVTDNRNPAEVRYHDGLIRLLGIDRDKLPDVVACTEVLGRLNSDVCRDLGLGREVRVVAGAIDNTAAAVGAGAVTDFSVHLYIGTSSWFGAHVPFKKTDLRTKLASIPCAVPGRYLMTAIQTTAGGNVTFLRDNLLQCQDELSPSVAPPDLFQSLDAMVSRVPAGASGVIYTPWLWGERAPVEDRCVRGGFLNLSLQHTRSDLIRSVLEGVAMNSRWCLPPIEKFMGRSVDSIKLVGGGARSDAWCQIFADVMNVEMQQVTDPLGANARGAAWIAAVGLGEIGFDQIPDLVPLKQSYLPNPDNRRLYDERFALFRKLYAKLKPFYARLNRDSQ
jgi:xylulokinase